MAQNTIELSAPDDWHVHLRSGSALRLTVPFTARRFSRAIIMPNLKPAVTSTSLARQYRDDILRQVPPGTSFTPLMTCYLTETTDCEDLEKGYRDGVFTAAKFYPAGATTHAESGVRDWRHIRPVLRLMQTLKLPLLIHGESIDPRVDVYDREEVFIERELIPLLNEFPQLKIVLEHITTARAVEFVQKHSPQLAATITPHHLMINRSDMFRGGLRPHLYCLPVAKREQHRLALRKAATSGHPGFFLGTDSAPHAVKDKESDCGCAGVFNSPAALELYTQVFDEENALAQLEAFASINGAKFYGLPVNTHKIRLQKKSWTLPEILLDPDGNSYRPFPSPSPISWQIVG